MHFDQEWGKEDWVAGIAGVCQCWCSLGGHCGGWLYRSQNDLGFMKTGLHHFLPNTVNPRAEVGTICTGYHYLAFLHLSVVLLPNICTL